MNYETTIGIAKSHDGNVGGGYGRLGTGHPAQGRTQGNSMPVYQYREEEESDPEEIESETDLERDIINAVRALTDSGAYTNPNRSGRADRSAGDGRNQGSQMGITEDSTTPVVKGISPRITYRQKSSYNTVPKNTKGPAHGAQSSATYIRNKPGRQPGTQYGTSRAPLPRHDEYDDGIFSLFDLADPMERSFIHHQKRVNKIKNMINYIEDE